MCGIDYARSLSWSSKSDLQFSKQSVALSQVTAGPSLDVGPTLQRHSQGWEGRVPYNESVAGCRITP